MAADRQPPFAGVSGGRTGVRAARRTKTPAIAPASPVRALPDPPLTVRREAARTDRPSASTIGAWCDRTWQMPSQGHDCRLPSRMAPRPEFRGRRSGAPVWLQPEGRDRRRSDLSLLLKVVACLDWRRHSLLVGMPGPQIADVLDGPDSIEAGINRRELAANFFHDGPYIDLVAICARAAVESWVVHLVVDRAEGDGLAAACNQPGNDLVFADGETDIMASPLRPPHPRVRNEVAIANRLRSLARA